MEFVNQVPKIVLTGGSGFLGTHLLNHEMFRESLVIGRTPPANHQYFESISFDSIDTLAEVLQGKDVVVHAAARAHVMKDGAESPLDEYRNINTVGTLNLATQAALAGVKRFIFISTIYRFRQCARPKTDRIISVFTKRTIGVERLDLELFLTPDK